MNSPIKPQTMGKRILSAMSPDGKRMNMAQRVLTAIGGTAALVAGHQEHYWADANTPKKQRTRGRVGGGTYGAGLLAHFAEKQLDAIQDKRAQRKARRKAMFDRIMTEFQMEEVPFEEEFKGNEGLYFAKYPDTNSGQS